MNHLYVLKDKTMNVARVDATKHLKDLMAKYKHELQYFILTAEKKIALMKDRYDGWEIKILDTDFDVYNLNNFIRYKSITTKKPYEFDSSHLWVSLYKFTTIDKLLEFLNENNVKYECKPINFDDYSMEYNKDVIKEEELVKINKIEGK